MRLTRYTPYRLIDQAHHEFDRLMNASPATGQALSRCWIPAFDVVEDADHFLLRADLPGVAREAIDIRLEKSVLTIRGERAAEHTADFQGYRRRERSHGPFVRRFTLPDTVDGASISARVNDGVLEISIPKPVAMKPRKITLN